MKRIKRTIIFLLEILSLATLNSCTKELIIHVSQVSLDTVSLTLSEGATHTLTASVLPVDATNKNINWKSSDNSVAAVDQSGNVSAIKTGTATIIASSQDGGKIACCNVTVENKVSGISLNKSILSLTEGESETLVATISPENATNKNLIWSSSDNAVATVDQNGSVSAIKSGHAIISVTTEDGGITATCTVAVNEKYYPVTGISLNKSSLGLFKGENETLVATISPENATNKNLIWSSSDNTVATIDKDGKICGIEDGISMITVKTGDGDYTALCEVSVFDCFQDKVDMGLPSGVKWASCNLGASSPEKFGEYYAWGETKTKEDFLWSNYTWSDGDKYKLIKYNTLSEYGPVVDSRIVLCPEDDAATQNLGDQWHIPSHNEWKELKSASNCSWVWTTLHEVHGYKVTSKHTGKSIFLPAAGYKGGTDQSNCNVLGVYWSSVIVEDRPYLAIDTEVGLDNEISESTYHCDARYIGQSIRPVFSETIKVIGITLDIESCTMSVGSSLTLSASVLPSNATNQSISWSSSDSSIAVVDQYGKVTTFKPGNATVSAVTADGGYRATCEILVARGETPKGPFISFESTSGQNSIKYSCGSDRSFEYSYDGTDWKTWEKETYLSFSEFETLLIRGDNPHGLSTYHNYCKFSFKDDSPVRCKGNIMNLISNTEASNLSTLPLDSYCFSNLFDGCKQLVEAPELPSRYLSGNCYENMFSGCSSLKEAPELPAVSLAKSCYESMFYGCSSLKEAPELPAVELDDCCYLSMFRNCSSLTEAPELPAVSLARCCYEFMFSGCLSLKEAPELPAVSLAESCYSYMFDGCTSLTSAPSLPATKLAESCYSDMFYGCSSLKEAPELPAVELQKHCYWAMFIECTSLTKAPKLPATKLTYECYQYMFKGCTSLTEAPKLQATTLDTYCYKCMFQGCTSLISAPALPATTLARYCYSNMFQDCTSLTSTPALPATTLASYCYESMFQGCSSLKAAPTLPATTLAGYCYSNMFQSCTSLTSAPMLSAMELANNCYQGMFLGCTSLTSAPMLSAVSLAEYCYKNMFQDCASLTSAPALPATTLASYCYESMFQGCSSLASAPALPATELCYDSYRSMFRECTSLTSAPVLPATKLAMGCYDEMFFGCKKLSYVKAMFEDSFYGTDRNYYIMRWLDNVNKNGTFVKSKKATWIDELVIPSGWTVEYSE